jgi:signal transduction histidine kinase
MTKGTSMSHDAIAPCGLATLQARIDDLTNFNRHVAHDLRDALASVVSIARLAQAAIDEGQPETALRMIGLAARQAQGGADLVADLLLLAQAEACALPAKPVDLADLARSAVDQVCSASVRDACPAIVLHALPLAWGVPGLLRQVFVNLVANAVKFTREVPHPRIEVGATPGAHGPVLYVKDNGVGFDPAQAARLFRPFERLHGAGYPGHGIGLSIVKRVVERHGGRVWAESRDAGGAAFCFTLGARHEAAGDRPAGLASGSGFS